MKTKVLIIILTLVIKYDFVNAQLVLKELESSPYIVIHSIVEKDTIIIDSLLIGITGTTEKYIINNNSIYKFFSGFGVKKEYGAYYTLEKHSVIDNKLNLVSSSTIWAYEHKPLFDLGMEISFTENGIMIIIPKICFDGILLPFEYFSDPQFLKSFLIFLNKQVSIRK